MPSLPSSKDANKALKGFSKSQEEWRNLILEVIELVLQKNDTSTDKVVKEACVLILQALNQFRKVATDDEYSIAESVVVDALWLKGALIEDSVRSINPTNEDEHQEKGDDEELEMSKMKYNSLCKLIKLLSSLTSSKESDSSKSTDDDLIPIPVRKFQLSLEPTLLAASELLPNKSVDFFIKRMKKVNTEMFYRQKKVNLMQEESEGYSKYMRFLTTLPLTNDTHSKHNAGGKEGEDSEEYRLKEMEFRVSEFIGTFDLDPNRCLDLTLDVLEAQMIQVIGTEQMDLYDSIRDAPDNYIAVQQLLCIIRLFPVENISHLIGFKYTNVEDGASKSLHLTTCLLIQHELVSLDVLRPHLPPSKLIDVKYSEWEKNTKTRIRKLGVVSLNASKADDNEQKSDVVEKEEDKTSGITSLLELFDTLLEVGIKWDCAVGIFGEDGKVTATNACLIYPKLGRTLCGLIDRRVSSIYSATVQNIGSDLIKEDSKSERISLHSLLLATISNTSEPLIISSSLVEVCEGLSDVFDAIVTSGCIANHSILFVKLCRLVKVLLQKNTSGDGALAQVDTFDQTVLSFLELFLVPSMSYFPNNPAIASELWSVLVLLPYQIRYALYGSSRKRGLEKSALRSMSRPPKPIFQIESEVNTSISTKFIFKRMSKENVKDMGRQLARVAHNNPMVVFTLMLNQIESYDNLIEMMVDSFKYMGILSLDVMGYCLLVSLGGEGEVRDKVKEDGVNTAQWLSSLETFTGAFYRRFPEVELRGLLSYVMRRVQGGFTLELGVLLSLLKTAGGYGFSDVESTASLSALQLEGRCGSLALRRETSDFGIVDKVNYRSSRMLRSVLQENSMGIVLLILLSQLREKVLFDESKGSMTQVKLIGNLYDKCHRTMNILLAFLTDGSEDSHDKLHEKLEGAIENYAKSLPVLQKLHEEFGLSNADAWTLCRPLIRASLTFAKDATKTESIPKFLIPFYPLSDDMTESYAKMIPQKSWNHISPTLFQTFFSYSIYDLILPEERYQTEIARVQKEIDRLVMLQKGGKDAIGMQSSMAAAVAAAGGTQRDIRQATAFTKSHDLDLQRYRQSAEMMAFDLKRQKQHCDDVRTNINKLSEQFFSDLSGCNGVLESARVFFTTCVYARCLLSPEDAMYCAHFIMMLHNLGTPGFYTIELLDIIVSALVGSLYSITEDEAGCLGIFFSIIWETIVKWRYQPDEFQKQVKGKPGAHFELRTGSNDGADDKMEESELSHEAYVILYNKWQDMMSTVFIGCLQSTEYIHTRTALILLTKMVDVFPTKSTLGSKLLTALEPLKSDSNPMQDIKTMALGYSSQISKRNDTGTWMEEDSKTAKARLEKEKIQGEKRKRNAELQMEEAKQDSMTSAKTNNQSEDARKDERRTGPRFVPPPGVMSNTEPRRSLDRGRDQDSGRRNDTRMNDKWERNGPIGDGSGKGTKRIRSPEPDRGDNDRGLRGSDRDKRLRRDPSPPRRGGTRRSARR